MDPQRMEVSQQFERFMEAFVRKDYNSSSDLLSLLKVLLTKFKSLPPLLENSPNAAQVLQAQPLQTVQPAPQVSAPTVTVPEPTSVTSTDAAPAAAVSVQTDVYGLAASNLVAGTTLESAVEQILDMGGGA